MNPLIWILEAPVDAPVAPSMSVQPPILHRNRTELVRILGFATDWLSTPPDFSVAGLDGLVLGSVTVLSDTEAVAYLTTGADFGAITWNENNDGLDAEQEVRSQGPIVMLKPAPTRWYRRGG